jgi:hypothetical protein
MTPQSNFMVVAPIEPGRMNELRKLLGSMADPPGMAKPNNPIVPFGDFDNLHYARFVILDDQTLEDFKEFGQPVPKFPVTLAFLGDCDGPGNDFLADIAQRAAPGLRQIFSHCAGFTPDTDLLTWMKRQSRPPAAAYVNYLGRTVRQVHEESKLRKALLKHLEDNPPGTDNPQTIRDNLVTFVSGERQAGMLTLTPPERTPLGWWVRNLLHLAIVPAGLLLLTAFVIVIPALLIALAILVLLFLWLLRRYEKNEPEIIRRPDINHSLALAELEDHDVTNQFSVIGSVKPSWFRRWTTIVILWLIDYGARHVYNRGFLSRIYSIQFARWVFLDGKRRVMFASNYDGNLESYMDDFINKVGWGLNLAFGGGIGYPRTEWMIKNGSKEEQKFKYTLRRHQVPTEVWYKAYLGLTAFDLARNTRVRQGIERRTMTDVEIRLWLRDL